MTQTARIRGVVAAIVTPLDAAGTPDPGRFKTVAEHLLGNGCDGLNVLGTTGEATSFSAGQRRGLMESVAGSGLPLERMMVGTGAAAVADAVVLTRAAADLGFAGALVLPPFYYKGVGEEGVVRYFAAIVEATRDAPIPIYLYNFPAQSGVAYSVPIVRRLRSEFGERIVGLKDSSGDLDYARAVAGLGKGFDVFPSNEGSLLEARSGSFAGCISATANLNAAFCARAYRDGDANALATAIAVRRLFDGKPLVAGVKALMAHIIGDPAIRAVLPPLETWDARAEAELVASYERLIARARPEKSLA